MDTETEIRAERSLRHWGMRTARIGERFARENEIFRVSHGGADYALRLHRPGYRSRSELDSELDWLRALADGGAAVPTPTPTLDGGLVADDGERLISLISWENGSPLGRSGAPLSLPDAAGVFHGLGAAMADLHLISDRWVPPEWFDRPRWDQAGLIGDIPLWGRFELAPFLGPDDRRLMSALREAATRDLAGMRGRADFGLIHADLVAENVLLGPAGLTLIDFDDGGWGHRLFDIATALLKHRNQPDYPSLSGALIAGYRTRRPIDTAALPLFMALRAATYLGWIAARSDQAGDPARLRRLTDDARWAAEAYLGQTGP